jgi:hypothetical protein
MALFIAFAVSDLACDTAVLRLGIVCPDSGAANIELGVVDLIVGLVNFPPPGTNYELIRYAHSL